MLKTPTQRQPPAEPNLIQTMAKRIVIKIGTNSLVHDNRLAVGVIANLVETCTQLQVLGHQVVIITSGSVGVGCQRMGITKRPTNMAARQALAAIGQIRLMRMYDDLFAASNQSCAQILLSFDNLSLPNQHRNAKNTFEALLKMGVVPIVNENDTVATSELKFGDNDRLSAMVAALVNADWLFLLTDVDGVYTSNPKVDPHAKRLDVVADVDELESMVSVGDAGSTFSTGGMATKLQAARIASAAGSKTVIMSASQPLDIIKALNEQAIVGTVILPKGQTIKKNRKTWILGLRAEGVIVINQGAARALNRKKNLLPSGIVEIRGTFGEMSCVSIVVLEDLGGEEVVDREVDRGKGEEGEGGVEDSNKEQKKEVVEVSGKGEVVLALALVNYTSAQCKNIVGCQMDEISERLGAEAKSGEVAHRGNIVLMRDK